MGALAADRTVDLSAGCKVFKLEAKQWVETESADIEGVSLSPRQILRDGAFTVFRAANGIYGVNARCLKGVSPKPMGIRQSAGRENSQSQRPVDQSPWAIVFSLGYNLGSNGTFTVLDSGTTSTVPVKFSSSLAFMGELNYRVKSVRYAVEFGVSQLLVSSQVGNEISFFDFRPEYLFNPRSKLQFYASPILGLFYFSQNAQTFTATSGASITLKQQNASSILLGLGVGADYPIGEQIDLGLFARYYKPGEIKVTGTNTTASSNYESKLSTSFILLGARFVIRF